jgi:hypothetical protein
VKNYSPIFIVSNGAKLTSICIYLEMSEIRDQGLDKAFLADFRRKINTEILNLRFRMTAAGEYDGCGQMRGAGGSLRAPRSEFAEGEWCRAAYS